MVSDNNPACGPAPFSAGAVLDIAISRTLPLGLSVRRGWTAEKMRYNQDQWEVQICHQWFAAKLFVARQIAPEALGFCSNACVDLKGKNLQPTTPNPFKPGDKVLCLYTTKNQHILPGDIYTVTEAGKESVQLGEIGIWHWHTRFKLATTHALYTDMFKDSYEITERPSDQARGCGLTDVEMVKQVASIDTSQPGKLVPTPKIIGAKDFAVKAVPYDGRRDRDDEAVHRAIGFMNKPSNGRPPEWDGDLAIQSNRGKS